MVTFIYWDIWDAVIGLVALSMTGIIMIYAWSRYRPLVLVMPVWLGLAWVLSQRRFFSGNDSWAPGDFAEFLVFSALMSLPILLFVAAYWWVEPFRAFVQAIPLPWLVGGQVYRLTGAVFLWYTTQAVFPPQLGVMTGWANIIIGLLALPLAWALARGVPGSWLAVWIWNIGGLVDFGMVIGIVTLSILGTVALEPIPIMIGVGPLALIFLFQIPLSICLHGITMQRLSQPISIERDVG